jgi:hypothetical protein
MTEAPQLPDLPLMLAGVPRPVAELLRQAGIPAETLPDVPLLAAGTGRFVLFDPHNSRSAALARWAASHGLKLIGLDELLSADQRDLLSARGEINRRLAVESDSVTSLLGRLKTAVESRGGVWVRLADYPFPYQSALCLGIEHLSEELGDFAEIAAALPGKATHFVSSRLRPDRLEFLAQTGPFDLGWGVEPADCTKSPQSTLSHWTARIERFAAAGLHPRGLAAIDGAGPLPPAGRLLAIGFHYACRSARSLSPHVPCRAASCSQATAEPWIRFSTLALPPRDEVLEWIAEHYQSGSPLFLSADSQRFDLVQELLRLAGDAGRCSLLWQTSFGDFSQWWGQRGQLRLQVWRRTTGYEIHATGEFGRYPWAIEIWRGNHLATLPMRRPELVVPDEGLVYLQSSRRNPAGCMTPGAKVGNPALPTEGRGVLGPFLARSRFRRKGSPQ